MKIDVVTARKDLPSLAPDWDALAQNDSRDGFFRTFGWYQAWIEHIRPDVEPFVIVARDNSQRIVGLAPLCKGTYNDLGFRLNGIFWAGREVVSGDFLDFLAEREMRSQVVAAILEFLEQKRSEWGMLIMGELVDGSESYNALENMGRRLDWPMRRQEERICPYIALPKSFDEYLTTLGSSTRYHIRRRMRDVEKRGARVEVYSQPEEVASRLDTLIELHLARWHKENLPGTMARPGFGAFLRQICTHPPANSSCRLYFLTLEGVAVAGLMAFSFGESMLYYQAGWEPDSPLSALSPAVVLMAHCIRDAIDQGFRYYEFLRGDEAYKGRWTKTWRNTATLLLARSFMAREYLRMTRLKDHAKSLLARNSAAKTESVECVESPVRQE